MSLVSVLKVKRWFGQKNENVFITFDSRVSDKFERGSQTIRTEYDGAEKVICISPNIIVGIAGDFKAIELVNALKEYLNKNEKYMEYMGFLKNEIRNFLVESSKEKDIDAEFIMLLKNHNGVRARVYKLCIPSNVFVEIDNNDDYLIHSIGSRALVRNRVREEFENEELRKEILYNGNSNIDSPVTISSLFKRANISASQIDANVGGYFNTYFMDHLGWHNVGISVSGDGGEHFVGSVLGVNGITIQVNGKDHMTLSSSNLEISKELQRRGSR